MKQGLGFKGKLIIENVNLFFDCFLPLDTLYFKHTYFRTVYSTLQSLNSLSVFTIIIITSIKTLHTLMSLVTQWIYLESLTAHALYQSKSIPLGVLILSHSPLGLGMLQLFKNVPFRSRTRAFSSIVPFLFLFSIVPSSFPSVPFLVFLV